MPVKCSDVFVYSALGRSAVETASAGDIVMVAGISEFNIGDTLVDPASPMPLEPIDVEQPTMSITMGVNKSAFAGRCKSSKHLTSRVIRERLNKELEVNVALQVCCDSAACAGLHKPFDLGGDAVTGGNLSQCVAGRSRSRAAKARPFRCSAVVYCISPCSSRICVVKASRSHIVL